MQEKPLDMSVEAFHAVQYSLYLLWLFFKMLLSGIMPAVRCVSAQINNTDSSYKTHFSIRTQSGDICGALQLCDEQRGGWRGVDREQEGPVG